MVYAMSKQGFRVPEIPILEQPRDFVGIIRIGKLDDEIPTDQLHFRRDTLRDFQPILATEVDVGLATDESTLGLPWLELFKVPPLLHDPPGTPFDPGENHV